MFLLRQISKSWSSIETWNVTEKATARSVLQIKIKMFIVMNKAYPSAIDFISSKMTITCSTKAVKMIAT